MSSYQVTLVVQLRCGKMVGIPNPLPGPKGLMGTNSFIDIHGIKGTSCVFLWGSVVGGLLGFTPSQKGTYNLEKPEGNLSVQRSVQPIC